MSITSEHTFESAIIESLVNTGGYTQGVSSDYSKDLGFFKQDIIQFLKTTQEKKWNKLSTIHGSQVENKVLQRIYKEMDLRGSLDVVRNGFTDYGIRFQLAHFQPVSGLNPDADALYAQNILKVTRQLYYSSRNTNSVDLCLSLNGVPVATLELKNEFTGQNTDNAKKQYAESRDKYNLLFGFKKRAFVHFVVDQKEVFMTTKLDGTKTYWLPFNKGHNKGKGNPPGDGVYSTAYLWEYILQKDSWMEIIQRFIHLQIDEYEFEGRTLKKETLIFPRYHQLDVVRKITKDVYDNGTGHNYLVQHSAGSGKSNSIAWLAYRLSSLHNNQDIKVFDSIIVVTDRRVLDQQLQKTIYQFEHKAGVVQKIDEDSTQLAKSLQSGTKIIITTLQKFPYVIEKVGDLPDRTYAVIIDEAHSSQGGEASKKMKEVLATQSLEEAEQEENTDDPTAEDAVNDAVEKSAQARGKQDNISFFAFTATPKAKTMAVFDRWKKDTGPSEFHLYSMRQAIEEGFILNVLENYTTYDLYYRLNKAIEDDPKLNKKKAAKAIGKYVSLHPYNVTQKTTVIIEHFRQVVAKKIGGRAKAMVVTGSRLHAKRYFTEFKNYIYEKGYDDEIKILVAFSGKVIDDDFPDGVSEPMLTGYGLKELPKVFDRDDYRILIVAEKYQTGFDQPLLHTMYVDKKLSGIKAVQTLSRLNRTAPGKEDTFVLDFVNDRETIREAFSQYYQMTTVKDETDVNHLFDLKNALDAYQIYWQEEIDAFSKAYFLKGFSTNTKNQSKLYGFTNQAVERFKELEEEKQDVFKKSLRTWTNLYSFMSQIMPFRENEFEKFFAYAKLLSTRLPKKDLSESLQLSDEVALEYYRLQKIKDGSIVLPNEDGEISGTTEAGLKQAKDEEAHLSEIIEVLNDRFGTEFEDADRLFFEQLEAELMDDEKLQTQARANKIDTFKYAFDELFINKLIGRMDQNQDIFEKILEDKAFGNLVKKFIMNNVYNRLNDNQ